MIAAVVICMIVVAGFASLARAIRDLDPDTLALPDDTTEEEVAPIAEVTERFRGSVRELHLGAVLSVTTAAIIIAASGAGRSVAATGGAVVTLAVLGVVAGALAPGRLVGGREAAVLGHTTRWVLIAARILRPLTRLLDWLGAPLSAMVRPSVTGLTREDRRPPPATPRGPLDKVLSLVVAEVGEVMTPRPEMAALEAPTTVAWVGELVASTRHSRFPVVGDSLDEVLGLVDIRDLLLVDGPTAPIEPYVRPVTVVAESKPAWDLWWEIQASEDPIAIVVDEFGTVAGLVTEGDLTAEIIGDITEEGEPVSTEFERLDEHVWDLHALLKIERVNELTGLDIPEGDYQTLAGFLLHLIGRVPRPLEKISWQMHEFEVLAASRRRIVLVRVRLGHGVHDAERRD